MKTAKLKGSERLRLFSDLYEYAKTKYQDSLDAFDRNMRQYRGSDEIDGSAERACMVRNVTYELIESQISSYIPYPKVDAACYSERRDRNAKSAERLLSSLREKLPFERMNDLDERYTYVYGGSVWYAEWDNTIRLGREVGGVRLYCLPPRDFIPQPSITEIEDMEYCFLHFSSTGGDLISKYGIKRRDLLSAAAEGGEACDDEGELYDVVVCFYRDDDGEVGKIVFSGELLLLDLPRAYRRKREAGAGGDVVDADELYEALPEGAFWGEGVHGTNLGSASIPYYVPRSFPIVIRCNTSADGKLFGQSDCEYVRPEQQAINKLESRILMKLLRAGITPIVPEDATISVNNSVFGQVIKMKPGESASQYGKVDTTPDVSQDIAAAERLYDHAKRILGISDALQGFDTLKNESGYARELRISQATGRLESKRKMKYTAYADIDRIIFELYLAFADEPRVLVYRDAYGRVHNAHFDRHDFIEYDAERGEFYYDDSYLFSIDLNGGAEYQREALWERNLENLKAGTLGDPQSPLTLLRYWQCQERAHYPHARENVEYFTLALDEQTGGYGYGKEADTNALS